MKRSPKSVSFRKIRYHVPTSMAQTHCMRGRRRAGAAEQGVREAHFRKGSKNFGIFFASPKELPVSRTREGFNKGRECTELQERRDCLRNACAAGLIAHINGSMAGALAESEAAVNSPTLARPKRCKNSCREAQSAVHNNPTKTTTEK